MSRRLVLLHCIAVSFPRVSGDEPLSFLEFFLRPMFSPRERG